MSTWAVPERPPNVRIVSIDGELVANRGLTSGATSGQAVPLEPDVAFLPKAVIAIEDRRFYSHFGIDPLGMARAMVVNLLAGHLVQGGSTLTQQLAKNLFLEPDRTHRAQGPGGPAGAMAGDTSSPRTQILELYLNRVYFGSGAYGVEAASRRYFNKSAHDLSLGEAALLAGLLKAPSRLSPARDPKAAEARAQVVLEAMLEAGFIPTGRERALAMQPAHAKRYWTGSQHYFADMVMKRLPALIGKHRWRCHRRYHRRS